MKQRSISAIGIVVFSVIPALIGGPFFALAIAAVMLLAFHELTKLVGLTDAFNRGVGYVSIIIAAFAAWWRTENEWLPAVLMIATLVPLASIVFREQVTLDVKDWPMAIGAIMYILLPAFAAVALRNIEGPVRSNWFQDFANSLPGPDRTAQGLGWFFLALFVTWMSDTAAYLVGRSIGRIKLIPHVSPNKTVEGAIGGLVAAGITGVLATLLFGLPIHTLTAILFGIILGAAGMIGDLSESMIKRRAGVKDSGDLIPGHGGMLDRIDALIFVLVATWAFQPLFA